MVTHTYTIFPNDFPAPAAGALDMINFDSRLKNGVFFDIETTGFSPVKNALYLIGCCKYTDGCWTLTQWLAEDESKEEQRLILENFFAALKGASTIISYNGQTFDLPFIEKKCAALAMENRLPSLEHWDLYKDIRSFRQFLSLDNLRLKTVEQFLGIFREDDYSGKELIPVYKSYAGNHSQALLKLLLLHNCEDIKDMLFILPVLAYRQVFHGPWSYKESALTENSLIITVEFGQPLPQIPKEPVLSIPLKGTATALKGTAKALKGTATALKSTATIPENTPLIPALEAKLSINTHTMSMTLPLIHGELKYFYENYKDYYYLPEEDYAIHKSVAAFVDKDYRKKASAQNCYTKKAGAFLPQPEQIFTPAFKFEYKDTLTWFEAADTGFSENALRPYVQSFLRFFSLGSF